MQRIKKTEATSKKPLWQKTTRGTLYPFADRMNVRLETGDTVEATEEELGKFLDQFKLVKDGEGEFKIKPGPKKTEKDTYRIDSLGGGKFEVVSSSGKVMSDQPLNLKKAEALKASLEKETVEE